MRSGVRTKEVEFLIQEGTMEQMEWWRLVSQHHAEENRAHRAAKATMVFLDRTARNHGVKHALELCGDAAFVRHMIKLNDVTKEHVELGVNLVQTCFPRRFDKPKG